jgi:hypothetical protein
MADGDEGIIQTTRGPAAAKLYSGADLDRFAGQGGEPGTGKETAGLPGLEVATQVIDPGPLVAPVGVARHAALDVEGRRRIAAPLGHHGRGEAGLGLPRLEVFALGGEAFQFGGDAGSQRAGRGQQGNDAFHPFRLPKNPCFPARSVILARRSSTGIPSGDRK